MNRSTSINWRRKCQRCTRGSACVYVVFVLAMLLLFFLSIFFHQPHQANWFAFSINLAFKSQVEISRMYKSAKIRQTIFFSIFTHQINGRFIRNGFSVVKRKSKIDTNTRFILLNWLVFPVAFMRISCFLCQESFSIHFSVSLLQLKAHYTFALKWWYFHLDFECTQNITSKMLDDCVECWISFSVTQLPDGISVCFRSIPTFNFCYYFIAKTYALALKWRKKKENILS